MIIYALILLALMFCQKTAGDSTRDGRNRDVWMPQLSLGPYLRDGWTLAYAD
jgi:hypothetical protein